MRSNIKKKKKYKIDKKKSFFLLQHAMMVFSDKNIFIEIFNRNLILLQKVFI